MSPADSVFIIKSCNKYSFGQRFWLNQTWLASQKGTFKKKSNNSIIGAVELREGDGLLTVPGKQIASSCAVFISCILHSKWTWQMVVSSKPLPTWLCRKLYNRKEIITNGTLLFHWGLNDAEKQNYSCEIEQLECV